jgi:hypothetical protein
MFRESLSVPSSKVKPWTLENGTDRLPRNVGNQLPTYTVEHSRTARAATTLRQKPETSNNHYLKDRCITGGYKTFSYRPRLKAHALRKREVIS